jgi:hypothetical protein
LIFHGFLDVVLGLLPLMSVAVICLLRNDQALPRWRYRSFTYGIWSLGLTYALMLFAAFDLQHSHKLPLPQAIFPGLVFGKWIGVPLCVIAVVASCLGRGWARGIAVVISLYLLFTWESNLKIV